jgi:hypothetical protein
VNRSERMKGRAISRTLSKTMLLALPPGPVQNQRAPVSLGIRNVEPK